MELFTIPGIARIDQFIQRGKLKNVCNIKPKYN